MYNEIIAKRLSNLRYLAPMKKSNITMISKNNKFGDIVKFFAQINTENVIQKISFKATGCSTFLSMCDFYCEIIEGKTIEDALNVTDNDLKNITNLDQSREHVYSIILDTFKLLVKKYNKGVAKNTIIPCEVITKEELKPIKLEKPKDIVSTNYDLDEILAKAPKKVKRKKIKETDVKETKVEIEDPKPDEEIQDEATVVIVPEVTNIEVVEQVEEPISEEKIVEVKQEISVVETVTETTSDKTIIEEKKTTHLMSLRQKIANKENNEKAHNHANSLNNMLQLMKKNKPEDNEKSPNENVEDKKPKKEKKSLFSWFKK